MLLKKKNQQPALEKEREREKEGLKTKFKNKISGIS